MKTKVASLSQITNLVISLSKKFSNSIKSFLRKKRKTILEIEKEILNQKKRKINKEEKKIQNIEKKEFKKVEQLDKSLWNKIINYKYINFLFVLAFLALFAGLKYH